MEVVRDSCGKGTGSLPVSGTTMKLSHARGGEGALRKPVQEVRFLRLSIVESEAGHHLRGFQSL